MFTTATKLDPGMCDAWLARILAGEQSIDVLCRCWSVGPDIRLGDPSPRRHGVAVPPGGFRRVVPAAGGDQRGVVGLRVRRGSGRERSAMRRRGTDRRRRTRQPVDDRTRQLRARRAVLPHERWPDVLATSSPEGKPWPSPRAEGGRRGDGHHGAGVAGVFEEAFSPRPGAIEGERVPARPTSRCTPRACACGTSGREDEAVELSAPGVFARREVRHRPRKRWTIPTSGWC